MRRVSEEQIEANRKKRAATYVASLSKDVSKLLHRRQQQAESKRRARAVARGNVIPLPPLQPAVAIDELPLTTTPTTWLFPDGSVAMKYLPGHHTQAEVELVNQAISMLDTGRTVPRTMRTRSAVTRRHGEHGRALNLAIWHEKGHPDKGLIASSDSLARTIGGRKAHATFLQTLAAGNIFGRANAVVRSIVSKEVYENACDTVTRAIKACGTPAVHLKDWGRRPFSSLTVIFDSPTLPHVDRYDYGGVPSICARFGTADMNDDFVVMPHGIRIKYNPGDIIVGYCKNLEHQVRFSDAPGRRYTLVHSLRQDVFKSAQ